MFMSSQKRIIKYQLNEAFKALAVFWGILLLVDVLGFIGNIYYNNMWTFGIHASTKISIVGGNTVAIFIFFIVYCYTRYYEDFPIAICLSVTRGDYFKSVVLENIIVSFFVALIEGILLKIEPYVISAAGSTPLQDFSIFNTKTDSLIYIVLVMFIAFFINVSFWTLVAALNYKFGYRFWIAISALFVLFIFMLNSGTLNFLDTIFSKRWLFFGVLTVACNVASYYITLNTNVKHRVG